VIGSVVTFSDTLFKPDVSAQICPCRSFMSYLVDSDADLRLRRNVEPLLLVLRSGSGVPVR